jgi:dephospho-CoA kinase
MLKLRKVAVTGGLSSGKTTVCRFLKELGAYVLSADEIVHQLLSSDDLLIQQVIDLLGSDVCIDGKIDRKKVAAVVFQQPRLLESLEKILHPAVRNVINQHFNRESKRHHYPLFIVEIPLLFETGADSQFDLSVAVISDDETCKKRFSRPEEYEQRMQRQMTPQEKAKRADFIIENNGSLEDLFQAVKKIYKQLLLKT